MKQTIFTVLAFAAFASACPVLVTRAAPCAPVHIIAARASGEAPGEGIIGSLIAAVIEESTQEITTAVVDYPATLSNYASSSAAGTKALTAQLTAQVAACPLQKIVLVGYSQGAHVIGDTLAGGGGGSLGPKTQPVAASVAANVVAAVLMGDPRHARVESFQQGTATESGIFPRLEDQSLEPFSGKIQSYCDKNDLFCASGFSTIIHIGYTGKYNTAAKKFILSKIGA